LAPTDQRFLDMTPEGIETEYWADFYQKNNGKEEMIEDDDFDFQAEKDRIDAEEEAKLAATGGVSLDAVDDWEEVEP
jgi:hypothetical protein